MRKRHPYTDNFRDFIEKLLERNSAQRLGSKNDSAEILQHSWFSDYQDVLAKIEA